MNCPNCGTYNPEDRVTCWRCDKELPKPKVQKRRSPQKTAQTWLYVVIAIFLVYTLMQTCGISLPFAPRSPAPAAPGGGLLLPVPPPAMLGALLAALG